MRVVVSRNPLSREDVLAAIAGEAAALRRLGVKSLALFGSVARGKATQTGDIDLLVDLSPRTFDAYMDVRLFLERPLGRRVDLVLADAVKPRLQASILAEAIRVAGL